MDAAIALVGVLLPGVLLAFGVSFLVSVFVEGVESWL
jgi:hypothetical protein